MFICFWKTDDIIKSPNSEPAGKLISRAAPSVEGQEEIPEEGKLKSHKKREKLPKETTLLHFLTKKKVVQERGIVQFPSSQG